MTTKEQVVALFTDDVEVRKKVIADFIRDKNNSFEDRKEVWENTPDHLMTTDQWIVHLDKYENKYGKISWFDDFWAERHEDVDLRNCAETLEYDKSEEQVNDFILECMDRGIHGFNLDW